MSWNSRAFWCWICCWFPHKDKHKDVQGLLSISKLLFLCYVDTVDHAPAIYKCCDCNITSTALTRRASLLHSQCIPRNYGIPREASFLALLMVGWDHMASGPKFLVQCLKGGSCYSQRLLVLLPLFQEYQTCGGGGLLLSNFIATRNPVFLTS